MRESERLFNLTKPRTCPHCKKNPIRVDVDGALLICEECAVDTKQANALKLFSMHKNTIMEKACIPKEYQKASIQDCVKLRPLIGQSALFTGSRGVGKTHAAVALLLAQMELSGKFGALFVTSADLLLEIRSCYNGKANEVEVLDKYTSANILVLDDIGAEKPTEWTVATLGLIIDRRYREGSQTIFTSNLTPQEISDVVGDRIASRILGLCGRNIIFLNGTDRRLQDRG